MKYLLSPVPNPILFIVLLGLKSVSFSYLFFSLSLSPNKALASSIMLENKLLIPKDNSKKILIQGFPYRKPYTNKIPVTFDLFTSFVFSRHYSDQNSCIHILTQEPKSKQEKIDFQNEIKEELTDIKRWLESDSHDINYQVNGKTLLHLAVDLQEPEFIKGLLKIGADPNIKDDLERTPFHYAIELFDEKLMNAFFPPFSQKSVFSKKPLNIDLQDSMGFTYLHLAIQKRNFNLVKKLTKAGANLSMPSKKEQRTPFMEATYVNDTKIALFLYKQGADIYTNDSEGLVPLNVAIKNNNFYLVDKLIQNGAQFQMPKHKREALWHQVAQKEDETLMELFIREQGTNIITQDENMSDQDMDKKKIININAQDEKGETILHYLVSWASPNFIARVLEHGADPSIVNSMGITSFIKTVLENRPELIAPLAQAKANVNSFITPSKTQNPIMIVKEDLVFIKNFNALQIAVLHNDKQLIEELLLYRANPNRFHFQTPSPLELIFIRNDHTVSDKRKEKLFDIFSLLLFQFNPNIRTFENGNTILHTIITLHSENLKKANSASEFINLEFYEHLVTILFEQPDINLTLKNKQNLTALDLAYKNNNQVMAAFIVSYLKKWAYSQIEPVLSQIKKEGVFVVQ